jgi:serine/threonine protein kinase
MRADMSRDGTDPATRAVTVPLEGDGREMIGQVIDGRYRLDATLGRGGMGLVFRATHLKLRRTAAVKLLHPSLIASKDVRNRFEREVYASGKIEHPNCVAIYDSGQLPDGSSYLAMELLEGRPLGDILEQEGQIAPGRALHILAHVLRGLSHIHSAGLIHRDIKPENIFLIRQGQDEDFAKILDFGIAKGMGKTDLDEGVKLTQAGMAFGTPIYMAPEQALGNPMDGRADLYAAAVLAYEMLCGQPPFYSDDKLEVMSMHTAKPVPPMRQRLIKGGRPVPASIERLIVRGLTKKPSERYANADVFLAAVEEALGTPDGGVTDVSIERITSHTTGSQPLVSEDGFVALAESDDRSARIADAIDDVLGTPHPGMPIMTGAEGTATVPRAPVTPPRGLAAQVANKRLPSPPVGGVGLGLPYTGPRGEPIFGLTPEQRLAQVTAKPPLDMNESIASKLEPELATTPVAKKGRPRWLVYAAVGVFAVLGGVLIALLTVPGGDDDDDKPDPKSPAGAADNLMAQGDFEGAIKLLEGDPVTPRDAQALLVLGNAYAARPKTLDNATKAVKTYARAMSLSADAEQNVKLRATLRTFAADDDAQIAAIAFDLWVQTSDLEARQAIANAVVSDRIDRRHAMIPVIERHKLGGSVEWWLVYSKDLEQEPTCPARKLVVGKLKALGDPRGVPTLERAIVRYGRGAPKGKYNWCLIDDAKNAIGYLNQLSKKTP